MHFHVHARVADVGTNDIQRPPGSWSLSPGQLASLRPRECGYLRMRGGRLWLNGRSLKSDEKVRLWSYERAQLSNFARTATGFFSWEYCEQQPSAAATGRRLAGRFVAWLSGWCRPKG